MRISAAYGDGFSYRVYDHIVKCMRDDLCWVDDSTNQLGVGHASAGFECISRIEQRKRVVIIPSLKWVSVDLPDNETEVVHEVDFEVKV